MLTRRNTLTGLGAACACATTALACPLPKPQTGPKGTNHPILMLNADCNNAQITNVFTPPLLHVAPGDSVTFLPTDKGHNAASKRGMIPEGAEPWNSPMDKEFTINLTTPGVYGYVCLPHYAMGMVGLIIVGNTLPNLEKARKLRHPGKARKAFRTLFKQLEENTA